MIQHRIFDDARAALLGYGEERIGRVVVEVDAGSSDYRIELSVNLERVLDTAAAGVPHNVGIRIDISRA